MDSARALLAEGDAAGAEVALRELLAEDESNPAVRVLLAQTVAFRDLSEAAGLVASTTTTALAALSSQSSRSWARSTRRRASTVEALTWRFSEGATADGERING
jgi:hypothetical protein